MEAFEVKVMSNVKWTKEQMEAITEKGCNLLVAAAAGSGKTAVLVERIIKKITDEKAPIDIDRLLVVTFTSAAATEMRERIGDAISKALEKRPDSKHLQRQLTLLNKATITTIHSFCLEVIRNNFHCIGLDPNFRVADQTESMLMKMEALEELFEEKYDGENACDEFLKLVECYGGKRDDQALQNIVFELYEFVQSCPWPEKWLQEKTEAFGMKKDCDFGNSIWGKTIMASIKVELSGLLEMMRQAVEIIQKSQGLDPYYPIFHDDIINIEALLKKSFDSWDALHEAIGTLTFDRLSRCKKDADKEAQERVKAIRNEVKARLKKIKEEVLILRSYDIINDLRKLYPLIKCLSELVLEFEEKYKLKKKEKSVLDFNDLEHYCLDILIEEEKELKPSQVALELREKFEEILVDEYQDSNLVQEVIISTISRKDSEEPNVFMVGDVKQSIYRFRQARPELFLEKYNTYSVEKGSKNRVVQLFKNFRSRKEIIDGTNFIFEQIMSENVGELNYNEKEKLNYGAGYILPEDSNNSDGREVELHIIDMNCEDVGNGAEQEEQNDMQPEWNGLKDDGEDNEELDNVQLEARIVGRRIKELVEGTEDHTAFKVYDKNLGKYRDIQYRDIAILLRTTVNWADVFIEELTAQGIPVYGDTGTGYFKTIEVETVMSLLQIIDNPMQDIPLLSVLRSPIGGFTPDELIDIRVADKEAIFFDTMKKLSERGSGKTAEKARSFLRRLDKWRDKARYMSTDELIWYLYTDTGYYGYVGAMPGGAQRQANLRILFERARLYEETSFRGLFNFINFINRLKGSRGDMGSAKILGEKENVVRIMSIHKSKGLEFPIVFVSGCGKKFNFQDMSKSILFHQDLGFGPDFIDPDKRISYTTVPKQALKYKIKQETLSEEMRILYVALTRAREKLIITGSVKDMTKSLLRWCSCICSNGLKLPEYDMLKASCFLDWVGPAVLRHRDFSYLRQLGGIDGANGLIEDESRWELKIWSKNDDVISTSTEESESEGRIERIEKIKAEAKCEEISKEVERRLNWQYTYKASTKIPTKISVTELKRFFNTEFSGEYQPEIAYIKPLITKPKFLQETKGLTAAEKGSVLHFVMQHLDLSRTMDEKEIKSQINRMVKKGLIGEHQAREVSVYKIKEFFNSDLGNRMLRSRKVYREIPFNIELKCTEIDCNLSDQVYESDTILLQGIIDCYFEEDTGLVLIDYKTDYVADGNIGSVKEKYRIQIEYYSKALEKITGKRVIGKYVYLFWNGKIVEY